MQLIHRAGTWPERIAIVDEDGSHTYGELLNASAYVAGALLQGKKDLDGARVAFLVPPGFHFVASLWGILRAGGIAVPLCLSHPAPELEHVLVDANPIAALAGGSFAERLRPLVAARSCPLLNPEEVAGPSVATGFSPSDLPEISLERSATILYTSGTTGKPKGVVATHGNIQAQLETLTEAWGWSQDDHILNVLPLHHVHGLINVLGCALWSGATWETLPRFDAAEVWKRFEERPLTLFMAVPTVYHRLIRFWEDQPEERREELSTAASRLRLMVSGSAALPIQTLERWRGITGHLLLERYGMTEIGMALSNPLRGTREPGRVGRPLPSVQLRVVDPAGAALPPGESGELQVQGPSVFHEYWRRPQATAEAFTADGWFRTGDTVCLEPGADGLRSYRILGRSSVDILKTGGYKVSALEIEAVLRDHPAIHDCAVVGLPDPEWGQTIAAATILESGVQLSAEELRDWARARLAPYKLPRQLLVLDDLPRNALGKVQKPRLVALFSAS